MSDSTSNDDSIDWTLDKCCTNDEYILLGFYFLYIIIFFLFYSTIILKPFRLLSVFVHEFGHASACWITGGTVSGIEVYNNEGGVTKFHGGCRLLVIPAGYVGGAFWGGAFVALSGNRIGATIVVGIISFALIISLLYKPNRTVVLISLLFTGLNVGAVMIEYFVYSPILEYISLFYGVFIGWYSVRDIYDDLITRTAEGSDAVACSQVLKCCHPRCVGVQFWLISFLFQISGLYCALVWSTTTNNNNTE